MTVSEYHRNLLVEYLKYITESGMSAPIIGRNMRNIYRYLEDGGEVSRKGWKAWSSSNAAAVSTTPGFRDSLLDFLSFAGVGYGRRSRTVKVLEKRSVISERNQRSIDSYAEYLEKHCAYSQHTVKNYLWSVQLFFEYSDALSTENVRRFVRTLEEKGLAPKTINLRINALSSFASFMKKPISVKRFKVPKKLNLENVPTEQEYIRLLEYLYPRNTDRWFFLRILGCTGVRFSEFLQITWEDVAAGETVIKGKGTKTRRVFFPKSLQTEARKNMAESGRCGIIAVNRSGEPYSQRAFSSLLKSIGAKAGVDRCKMHAHAFRHFFAKMYLKRSGDAFQLAELLGHEKLDTTRLYLQKNYVEQRKDYNRNVNW